MQESSGSILSAHTAQDVDTGGSLATGRFAACAAAQLRCDSSPLLDVRLLQAVRSSQPRPSAKQPLPWGGSTRGSVLKTPLDGARGLGKLGSLATRRLTLWLTKVLRADAAASAASAQASRPLRTCGALWHCGSRYVRAREARPAAMMAVLYLRRTWYLSTLARVLRL